MADPAARWRDLERVFGLATERAPAERPAFLQQACPDAGFRREVERLLAADRQAADFLTGPAAAAGRAPQPPALGPYQLVRKIGQGGTSEVWLAVRADQHFRRQVAIKLARRNALSDAERLRLRRERQILASLDHPNIAKLYDAGTAGDGRPYVVMELVEGEPITDYCDRHRLRVDERLALFRTLCAAVHYAHQNLIVHRDIKPSNVLVTEGGEPKLLDFGIAKLLRPELTSEPLASTLPWQRLLTPDYASPEQLQGRAVTTASDLYSLGVLLYELLTGRLPHRLSGLTPAAAERVVAERDPQPPSAVAAETRGRQPARRLAGDLDTIVLKALSKTPHRRYASAVELAEDLRRHLTGRPVIARPPTFGYRALRFLRRNRLPAAAAATFLLVLLAAALGLGVLSLRLAGERDLAARERDKARQFAALLEDLFEVADPMAADPDVSARDILRRGAAKVDLLPPEQDQVKADLLTTIGTIQRRLGLLDEAAPALESALAIRRRVLGEDHPAVADSLVELGRLRRDAGRHEDAERLQQEALTRRRRRHGERHPAVAESLREVASDLALRGRNGQAETLLRQSLAIYRRLPGAEHESTVHTLRALGGVLYAAGRLDESEAVHLEVAARYRQRYGDDHPANAEILIATGSYQLARGDYDAAAAANLEALEILRAQRWEQGHPTMLKILNNLGAIASFQGQFAEAERYYRQALEQARAALGPDHVALGYMLHGLGLARRQLGDLQGAEEALRRAVDLRRRRFGASHPMTAKVESLLGACLVDLGRLAEAEDLLLPSFRVIEAEDPPRPRDRAKAAQHLVALYQALDRPALVARYQALIGAEPPGRPRP